MKSKTSYFNKTIFKKNITHFWPIWLIILIWNLFIMPFMIYNSSFSYRSMDMASQEIEQMRINDIISISYAYANPVVLFIFSTVAVMAVFSYLYNARSANTIHALPVTRKSLFLTNYISGLLFLLVPEVIGFLTGILVGALCGYTSMNHLLTGLLFAAGNSFISYSFTVLVAMFTGQLLAVPIFALILNFLYVGCKTLVSIVMSLISYGMPMTIPESRLDALSPLYYITNHMQMTFGPSESYSVCTGISGGKIVAFYAVAAVFAMIAAYLIYRIRNMETAGSLISISWICPVFRWGVAFCGGILLSVLFCSIMNFWTGSEAFLCLLITSVLFGSCSFFGAQMFLEKGFRVFRKKRVVECGVFAGVLVCLIVSIECDLFGQEKKLPEASEIMSANISSYSSLGGSDEEMIEEIRKIHQKMIDSKKEFEAFQAADDDIFYVNVNYSLKNGSNLRRQYGIPASKEMLQDESTVIRQIAGLNMRPEVYASELFGIYYDDIEPRSGSISLRGENGEWYQHDFAREEAEILYRAILADIQAGNFKNCIMSRYDYETYSGSVYHNYLNMEYLSEEETVSPDLVYANTRSAYGSSKVGYANISFDANCKNTIEALINTGLIAGEEELITAEENEKLSEGEH